MIVKWNNNIVEYKFNFFLFFFQNATNPSFFFLNVGLCQKKKKKKTEHATYDIRDSYYKPVAPALCWCNPPPGSAPSHRAGLEPGFPAREAGALTRNAKGQSQSLERLFLRSGEWGLHTAFTGIHICYMDIPQRVLTHHLSDEPPEWVHIAFRLKTGSALIAVWKRTASCSTF